MIRLGEYQKLYTEKETPHGLYLVEKKGDKDHVLLPGKYITDEIKKEGRVRVFIYKDSEDRNVATTERPAITLGEVRPLVVKEVSKVGGFLDWHLDKDLFLPYGEMYGRVEAGDEILVRLYIDKSGRLAASMKKLYPLLSRESSYAIGDEVEGRIYEFGHDFGTFVAVDDKYSAMIPKHESATHLRIGDVITARVTGVKDDGKLDITMRGGKSEQMDDDGEKILKLLDEYAGVLPFTEKASPAVIFRETGLSKAAFKRAVGRLYKQRRITINDGKIKSVN